MKRSLAFVVAVLVWSQVFASKPVIVYGAAQAIKFNSVKSKVVYIQLGSFLDSARAEKLKSAWSAKLLAPVRVLHNGSMHTVLVGPFNSPASVRRAGNILQKNTPVTPVKSKIKLAKNMRIAPRVVAQTTHQPVALKPEVRSLPKVVKKTTLSASKKTRVMLASPGAKKAVPMRKNWFLLVGGGKQSADKSNSILINNNSGLPAPYTYDVYSVSAYCAGSGKWFALGARTYLV